MGQGEVGDGSCGVSFKGKLGAGTHFCAYFWPRRSVSRDRTFWGGYEVNSTDN